MLANILKENNVDNSGMRFDPNARTALGFVTLTHDGEREFLFFRNPSADMLLTEAELDVDLIKKVHSNVLFKCMKRDIDSHSALTNLLLIVSFFLWSLSSGLFSIISVAFYWYCFHSKMVRHQSYQSLEIHVK